MSLTIIDNDKIKIARTFIATNSILCPPVCSKEIYLCLLVGADGNAPRALTSLPLGTDLQSAVGGNTRLLVLGTGIEPVFPA
jgi:hypothetical protein